MLHPIEVDTKDIVNHLSSVQDDVKVALADALRQNAFSNRMMIAPRQLSTIAAEEVSHLLRFVEGMDIEAVKTHGRQLALNGLGQTSVLQLCATLRVYLWSQNEASSNLIQASLKNIEVYTAALLEGYMQGREEELREKQEKTRAAYIRTLDEK